MSEFLIALITVLIYIAVVATWFFALFDLFARRDIAGWSKALWLFAIVFVPVIGVLVYFAVRPRKGVEELYWSTGENLYARTDDSVAFQVQTLAQLRKDGALTDDEFSRMKQKVMI